MSNKYYDANYTDHLIFFDEPIWLTETEWDNLLPGISGAYDPTLLKTSKDENTKLPFVYRCKHDYGDDTALVSKLIKDGTECYDSIDPYECFVPSVFEEVSDEYKKYHDDKYEDCIEFFYDPVWVTIDTWSHVFPYKIGAFDLRSVKDPVTENTELPFMYYEKNANVDRERIIEKLIKDGLYGLCISNKDIYIY